VAGYGVKVVSNFEKGDFLLEYRGQFKELTNVLDDTYLYTFNYKSKTLW